MHPTPLRGAIIKIRGVLEIAERDRKWAEALAADPVAAIKAAGLDLSNQEMLAIVDIVKNRFDSSYASPPHKQESKYPELRELWGRISTSMNT